MQIIFIYILHYDYYYLQQLSVLNSNYAADKVATAELTENYHTLRSEFKLLLSQPQFKNIRVNNKISKLLNDTSGSTSNTHANMHTPQHQFIVINMFVISVSV